jgi:hypothetical protein
MLPKHWYLYSSKSDDGGRIHRPDKSDTIFATFSAPMAKTGKRAHKCGIGPAENSCVPPYVFIPDRELDFVTDSHVKLDILVDTQEPFENSHHKVAHDYDEDTVSLVEELTLSTLDISLSNNSNSSAGNAFKAFEYECYEIEADTPQLNYHGQKIKIPKQELPVTICTADTICTIRSQRIF